MQLRDYQRKLIDDTYRFWQASPGQFPCLVLSTGGGKTVVFSFMTKEVIEANPNTMVLILAHRKELIEQTEKKLLTVWPEAPVGCYAAGLGRREMRPITVASRDTFTKVAHLVKQRKLLVIIDEAQNIAPGENTRYRKILTTLQANNPGMMVVGVTATPFRGNGYIYGDDKELLFQAKVQGISMKEMISRGYLSRVTAISVDKSAEIDTSGITSSQGDFNQKQLAARSMEDETVKATVEDWHKKAYQAGRKHTLFFCVSVAHAEAVSLELLYKGIQAPVITGDTPREVRDRTNAEFLAGQHVALVSVGIYTEGTDFPLIDCVAVLRATKMLALWLQIVGRGMRPSPETGKTDCIAEGQRVLTDQGLVPIERVTLSMKVWDGVSFVTHRGAICKGEQEVITYAGLTATPDHKVWTKKGWQSFGLCADKQIAICVTGNGQYPLRETQGHRRNRLSNWIKEASKSPGRVYRVSRYWFKRLYKPSSQHCGLSQLRPLDEGSKRKNTPRSYRTRLDHQKSSISATSMQQSKGSQLRKLWRSWNSVQISFLTTLRNIFAFQTWLMRCEPSPTDGPDRQRWSLSSWEHSAFDSERECLQYERKDQRRGAYAPIQNGTSRSKVRGLHPDTIGSEVYFRGDCSEISPIFCKTKRRVWDILNAGPLHRFTVEGLLVSNCLILDYGGCVDRFGPIDIARPAKRGKKKAVEIINCPGCTAKISSLKTKCPHCDKRLKAKPHTVCSNCGEENPPSVGRCLACDTLFIRHDKESSHGTMLSTERVLHELYVHNVSCISMQSKSTGQKYLKIVYRGKDMFAEQFHKSMFIGYPGRAGDRAAREWAAMTLPDVPVASDPHAACRIFAAMPTFKPVHKIKIDKSGKYPEIVSVEYENVQTNNSIAS